MLIKNLTIHEENELDRVFHVQPWDTPMVLNHRCERQRDRVDFNQWKYSNIYIYVYMLRYISVLCIYDGNPDAKSHVDFLCATLWSNKLCPDGNYAMHDIDTV